MNRLFSFGLALAFVLSLGFYMSGGASNFSRLVLGDANFGSDPNTTADITLQNDEYISNYTDGTINITAGVIKHGVDAAAYWTATQADAGAVTFDGTSDGTAGFKFADQVLAPSYNFASATAVTGSADSIVIDFTPDLASLAAGLEVVFVAEAANTGATTLIIDGGAEKNIYEASDVSALEANDIRSGSVVRLVYDGTQWQQISQSGN